MLAEQRAYELLTSNQNLVGFLDEIRGKPMSFPYIFVGTPNDTFHATENAPWIRITRIPGEWFDSADDERIIEYPRVQIDFWIAKEKLPDLDELESMIYQTMHDAGFERYYVDHVEDSDTPTLIMVQGNFEGFIPEEE